MAQHDYSIANQGFPAFRSDLNDALAAIVSNNSGATEPSTMFAHQIWVDTAADPSILKIRNADNDAWITIGTINQTADTFKLTPAGGISTDTIAELTSAAGVTIDGVLLKDGLVNTLTVGQGAGSVSTNTAVGASALAANTTGAENTAVGTSALTANTTGIRNNAVGIYALTSNTTGSANQAFGEAALYANTTGSNNVAVGGQALRFNTTASNNTAVGYQSLYANTTGGNNTAVGYQALTANTTGGVNVAVGSSALFFLTTGNNNTALGHSAGEALTTGGSNVFIGRDAGDTNPTTGSFNTLIGWDAQASAAGGIYQIVIAGDNNQTVGKGDSTGYINPNLGGVYQGNNSSSWSTTSDQRLKKNIVDNTEGLEKINALRVRNFEYRTADEVEELDPSCAIRKTGVQLGVIAQEIQQVCPDCVKEESTGVLSVDSDNVFWHMVNAIKELSAQVTALQAEVNTLKGQ